MTKPVPGTQTSPSIQPETNISTGPASPYNKPADNPGPKKPAKPMKQDAGPSAWHDAGCSCNLCMQ